MRIINLIIFIFFYSLPSYSSIIYTVCDGDWSNSAIWQGGTIPDIGDSIFVNHNVSLNSNLSLDNNYLEISTGSEICGLYNLQVNAGSKVLVDGVAKLSEVNLSDTMIINGTFYTNAFVSSGLLIINGSLVVGWNGVCNPVVTACSPPIADFAISDTTICAGECINLFDNSVSDPNLWNWQLTGSNLAASTVQNPGNICYSSPGNYSIKLIVSNSAGNDSITKSIIVKAVSIDTINISTCSNIPYFAGGNMQTASGYYNDTLINSNGCDSITVTDLTVHPVYFDSISVYLCLGDSIYAGGSFQHTSGQYIDSLITQNGCDSIFLTNILKADSITGDNTIKGIVYYQNLPVETGIVKLLLKPNNNPNSIFKIDSVSVNSNGEYIFENVGIGEYLIKAKGDTTVYPNSVTTYADSTNHWQYAKEFNLNSFCADTLYAPLYLIDFASTIGHSRISGKIRDSIGNGIISNIDISLININNLKVVGASSTNNAGGFHFHNIEPGDYSIYIDKEGYAQDTINIVNIEDSTILYIELCINNDSNYIKICEYVNIGMSEVSHQNEYLVYPNPTNDILTIVSNSLVSEYDVEIVNSIGKSIMLKKVKNELNYSFNVSGLTSGLYFVFIKTENRQFSFKLIKN